MQTLKRWINRLANITFIKDIQNYLFNRKIAKKLFLGFSIILFLFLIFTGISFYNMKSLSNNINNFYTQPYQITKHLMEIQRDSNYILQKLYMLCLDPSSLPIVDEEIKMATKKLNVSLLSLESKSLDAEEMSHLTTLITDWNTSIQSVIALFKEGSYQQAHDVALNEVSHQLNRIAELITPMYESADTSAHSFILHSDQTAQATLVTLFVLLLCVLLTTLVISQLLIKSIQSPIQKILAFTKHLNNGDLQYQANYFYNDEFKEVLAQLETTTDILNSQVTEISVALNTVALGDMTISIDSDYKGEFAPIKDSLYTLTTTLNDTLVAIENAAEQVALSSHHVSASSNELAQGASTQSLLIESFIASIAKLTHHVSDTTHQVNTTHELSNTCLSNAQQGNTLMANMVRAMDKIDDSTQSISQIIDIIQSIVKQTHLLALNAAIEAARAGESGKGFAVLAKEIRDLAAKSSDAAKDITTLISDNLENVSQGKSIARSTSTALEEIVESTKQTAQITQLILQASTKQSDTLAHLSNDIQEISTIIETNTGNAEEGAAISQELSAQSDLLRQSISHFKLNKKRMM